MATLKDIKKRVKSVKSTEKITRAMKMVAASKLKRAQDEVKMARPYSILIKKVLFGILKKMEFKEDYPLLSVRKPSNACFIVFTSDKGLCGGLNSSIIRKTSALYMDSFRKGHEACIYTIGKKGDEVFNRLNFNVVSDYVDSLKKFEHGSFVNISSDLISKYTEKKFDIIYLVYNKFISALTQEICVERLLPVGIETEADDSISDYEPDQSTLLNTLVPRYLSATLYKAALESIASEHGARMTAMDSATRNAKDMIDALTLQYNRVRQASITRELMEIIGGAEALK
jgi:F-type H+-transporting ATPase subunit gamma